MSVLVRYAISGTTSRTIASSIEHAIRMGKLAPRDSLPTVRGLALALGVSPATVAASYRLLRTRGIVTADGRRGTQIAPRPPLLFPAPPPLPSHLRNLADGNPDPELLPPLALSPLEFRGRLYGEETSDAKLVSLAARQLEADGIPAVSLGVVGGALDGIERVLQAHLRPGDRVAVEDPGYTDVLDLVMALGLVPEPVGLDDFGPLPDDFERALRKGVHAVIVTPRAQNPTGAALDARRAQELGKILDVHGEVLLVEDDHAGPVAGTPAFTLAHKKRERWAVVRSVSKSLGPDLRVAILSGDPTTVARVEGRRALASGWVSHILQGVVAALWSDPKTEARLQAASKAYADRRDALIKALARHDIPARGRSGLNVWIPVRDEAGTITRLAGEGWAVRGGERYRLKSPPAIRVTTARMPIEDAARFAEALARSLARSGRARLA
jgi:DNA-binding transcriptional MocR family regulator